jgi:hypothetical protein
MKKSAVSGAATQRTILQHLRHKTEHRNTVYFKQRI